MTATNHDGHNYDDHNWRQRDRDFAVNLAISYKYAVSFFYEFIAVAVMV